MASPYERIYTVVRRIPKGRVASYGLVAALAGMPRHARQVGYAMSRVQPADRVPWQRVVNARGEVSPRAVPGFDAEQRKLLEKEGVAFDSNHRIKPVHFWRPAMGGRGGRRG